MKIDVKWMKGALAILGMACAGYESIGASPTVVPDAPSGSEAKENWPNFGRTNSANHFSPLRLINADNVSRLRLKWHFDIPGVVLAAATPLEVDGVLYFASGYSVLRAVNAVSGQLLWSYDLQVARVAGEKLRQGWGIRGIAYSAGKIFAGTQDGRLIAVDASSGKLSWSILTTQPNDHRYITGPPLTFKDKVMIGHAGADVGGVRGYMSRRTTSAAESSCGGFMSFQGIRRTDSKTTL